VFAGDFGGFVGLFLGGSVITFFEILDLIFYNVIIKMSSRRQMSQSNKRGKPQAEVIDMKPYRPTEPQENDWIQKPKTDEMPKLHSTYHY